MTAGDISLSLIALLFLGAVFFARRREKRQWNNGHCRECGAPWGKKLTFNGTGDRLYMCSQCSNEIWISYNVDKEQRRCQ